MKLPLLKREKVALDTYEITLDCRNESFSFEAGQYVHISIPQLKISDYRGNGRDFSLSSSPTNKNELTVTIRASQSPFKKALLDIPLKTLIDVSGPFGFFTLPKNATMQKLLFIAGGIGITPFMSILRSLHEQKIITPTTLLYSNTTVQRTAYKSFLEQLTKDAPQFTVVYEIGRLKKRTLKQYGKTAPQRIYIAGAAQMVAETREELLTFGIPSTDIVTEEFTGYNEDEKPMRQEPIIKPAYVPAINRLDEGNTELSKRSLADLQALLQALNNTAIVSETDVAGTITYVNDKFVEIAKYPRNELIGQNHRILKSGFHSKSFYDNLWATITRGRTWRGLIKNKAKDNSFYWVDSSIVPIFGGNHKPIKYISVRFPVTEMQLAEEALKERSRQQDVVTTLSQQALSSNDLSELFLNATTLLAKSLNVEHCEVLKLLPGGKEFVLEAGVGWNGDTFGKVIVSAGPTDCQAGYTIKAQGPVVVEDLSTESRFSGAPFLHDRGIVGGVSVVIHGRDKPYGVLGVFVKEKRKFPQSDINFIQSVANLLANAERMQFEKRKDEFLSIASHELRTPLTSITSFTQLLKKQSEQKQDNQSTLYLTKIDGQLTKLNNLIGTLLDITKINSGKIDYLDEQCQIGELTKEVIDDFQIVTTSKHKIALFGETNAIITADKYRIEQVLTNLLSNAVKYSPEADKIIINIQSDGTTVTISVQDFGVGISKSEQNRIFDRFYQGDGKKDDFPGGLGLGLYISSEIVKRHGGKIWVESTKGKGSTFFLSLPLRKRRKQELRKEKNNFLEENETILN